MKKTIYEHIETIKYPKIKKFLTDNIDHNHYHIHEKYTSFGYAITLFVNLGGKNKTWWNAVLLALLRGKLT